MAVNIPITIRKSKAYEDDQTVGYLITYLEDKIKIGTALINIASSMQGEEQTIKDTTRRSGMFTELLGDLKTYDLEDKLQTVYKCTNTTEKQ